jgi:hypothetical protein
MQRDGTVFEVGSEGWYQEYRVRAATIMDSARSGQSQLYWIGLPPMRDPDRDTLARRINSIVADESGTRAWVSFVDIYATFTGPEGGYANRITGPDGANLVARAPDGVHISHGGSTWVADRVWAAIAVRWGLAGG